MPHPERPAGRTRWVVLLRTGVVFTVVADGTYVDGGDRVFELAIGSRPVVLKEVLRIVDDAIDDFESSPEPDVENHS